jgi:hypothetical protein
MVKVNVKLSLCLVKHNATKTYWGSGGIAPRILTSALEGGEWSASRRGRFTPRKRAPGTHWIGGWVDTLVKRKIPSPCRQSNLRTPIVQSAAHTMVQTVNVFRIHDPGTKGHKCLQSFKVLATKVNTRGDKLRYV